MTLVSKPDAGSIIAENGITTREYQTFFDDLEQNINGGLLSVFTVGTLPRVVEGGMIYVSDEVGGGVPAFSDGVEWRRVTDRAIVS